MTAILFRDALLLDTVAGALLETRDVLVEDGRIREVADTRLHHPKAEIVDLRGRVLMPGLCDAHVHVLAATANLAALLHWSPTYTGLRAGNIMESMLLRGFTTVRDAGGADWGLAQAVEEGWITGPRLLFGGKALSQTGGHGDLRMRGQTVYDACACCAGLARICDGVDEVRRAARDEIRKGAHHIKIMASGGVASPTDRIGNLQFSRDEMTAAVEEAESAGIYVLAHAYTAAAINRALECGVRSIEHGNLLDESTIALFRRKDAFLVPTLVTYEALAKEGLAAGLPPDMHAKVFDVLDAGLAALERAYKAGVRLVYGTDLLGSMQSHQGLEFTLRAKVQAPIDVIRSATTEAAELFRMVGEIGRVAPGAHADLLVVDGNPLDDLTLLQEQGRHLRTIMKGGRFYKNELA